MRNFKNRGNSRFDCHFWQNPKLFGKLAKELYQRWHLKHLIPLFFVMLYMLLGAILFLWLEAAAEQERIADR